MEPVLMALGTVIVVPGTTWIVKKVLQHERDIAAMKPTLDRVDERVEKLYDKIIEGKVSGGRRT